MNTPLPPLSRAVRARRRALNLTQAEVSRLAGVGPVFVHNLESGKPTVQLDKVLDVLAVLGLGFAIRNSKVPLGLDEHLAHQLDETT